MQQQLTPQKKSAQGLPLSAEDIKALINEPNSWLQQLYTFCITKALIKEEIIESVIRYAIATRREVLALLDLDFEKQVGKLAEDREAARQDLLRRLDPTQESSLTKEDSIKTTFLEIEKESLLSLSQKDMTLTQLTVHRNQLRNHLHNELRAYIGPKLVGNFKTGTEDVPFSLEMPKEPFNYEFSAQNQIGVKTLLQNQMASVEPKDQQSLVNNVVSSLQNQENLDYLLHEVRAIILHNCMKFPELLKPFKMIDPKKINNNPDNFNLPPSIVRVVDQKRKAYADNNSFFMNHLKENGLLLLEKMLNAPKPNQSESVKWEIIGDTFVKVSQPPAMFGQTGQSSQQVLDERNEETAKSNRKRKRT